MIQSLNNQLIKQFTSLTTLKGRKLYNQFIASGTRTCATIMQSIMPDYLVTTNLQIMSLAPFNTIEESKIIVVNEKIMAKVDPAHTTSGLVGVFPIPPSPNIKLLDSTVVLAQLMDPGNMGTLMRTAAALGKKSIVCIETVDPWNPKVIQASAGTIVQLAIFNWTWKELLANKDNKKLYALVVQHGQLPTTVDYTNHLLVVGNEAHGIPEEWIAQCDGLVTIPMPGNTESLNAAVAGSIALYLVTSTQLFDRKK